VRKNWLKKGIIMKIRILFICLILLITSKIFADGRADAYIAQAKKYLGSIKNYKAHKIRINSITNNHPAGKPGIASAYQKQNHDIQTKNIIDAREKAQKELNQAKNYANAEQQNVIKQIEKQIDQEFRGTTIRF
jgi:hypothetical protein